MIARRSLFYFAVGWSRCVATPAGDHPHERGARAALLIVSLLGVAVVFFRSARRSPRALEVIIYAGAIMVLFVFVRDDAEPARRRRSSSERVVAPGRQLWIGPVVLAAMLLGELLWTLPAAPATRGGAVVGRERGRHRAVRSVSRRRSSSRRFLLLGALVGAFHIGRRDA